MKKRLAFAGLLGALLGLAAAIVQIRAGAGADQIRNGPWITNLAQGSASAPALTRARVALGGLLALPRAEAMYFVADTDSDNRPLDGRCRYRVEGGALDAGWWSITLYEGAGWLVANDANRWSVPGHAPGRQSGGRWAFEVGPSPESVSTPIPKASGDRTSPGLTPARGARVEEAAVWLPTGGVPRFDLTLRAYLPQGALRDQPAAVTLPTIRRLGCGS